MFIVKTADPTLPGRVESLINNTLAVVGARRIPVVLEMMETLLYFQRIGGALSNGEPLRLKLRMAIGKR